METQKSIYAGFWRRLASVLIDLVITLPVYVGLRATAEPLWIADAVYVPLLCVMYCYCFASKKQATPGMRIMRVKAVDVQGARLGFGRTVVWCVTSLVVMTIVMSPIYFLQKEIDVRAVNAVMVQAQKQQLSADVVVAEVEALTGMPYDEYYGKLYRAFLISLGLIMLWIGTIVAGKHKAGVHNVMTGVRFIKVPHTT